MKDQQGDLLQHAEKIGDTAVVVKRLESQSMDELRDLGDRIKDRPVQPPSCWPRSVTAKYSSWPPSPRIWWPKASTPATW
jgi:hypothetical protein